MDKKTMRELRSQAQNMSVVLWIGRNGVTDAVVGQVSETLDSRELIKCAVQDGSPVDAREAGEAVASRVGGTLVQVIGRRFVLFRPIPDDKQQSASKKKTASAGKSRSRAQASSRSTQGARRYSGR